MGFIERNAGVGQRGMQILMRRLKHIGIKLVKRISYAILTLRARCRHRQHMPIKITRLVVVNMDNIGDVLFGTPALRALRRLFPHAHITMVVSDYAAHVVQHNPYIDHLIVLSRSAVCPKEGTPSLANVFEHCWRLIMDLSRQNFDLGVIFEVNERVATWVSAILYLAGVPYRVGWQCGKYAHLLSASVPHGVNQHKVEEYLNIVRALGGDETNKRYDFFVSDEDMAFAKTLLQSNDINDGDLIVGIHPGALRYVNDKRWPVENYRQLARALVQRYGAKLLVTGTSQERTLAEQVVDDITDSSLIITGRTTLTQFAALLRHVRILVTNDTGSLHIGYAVGVPKIVAIFGPSDPCRYAPPPEVCTVVQAKAKVPCVPCEGNGFEGDRARPCFNPRGQECLSSIAVEEVLSVIDHYLDTSCVKLRIESSGL
jgi:heptosyltransferase-2